MYYRCILQKITKNCPTVDVAANMKYTILLSPTRANGSLKFKKRNRKRVKLSEKNMDLLSIFFNLSQIILF